MHPKDTSFKLSDNLNEVETIAWAMLSDDDMRVVAVSSLGDRNVPEVRHLILRNVDAVARGLVFWTDIRSPKILSFNSNNAIALSVYSHERSVQISCKGCVTLHSQDEIAALAWEQATSHNKALYSRLKPGQEIHNRFDGMPKKTADFTSENTLNGYKNFAVITAKIKSLDLVYINNNGNSRACFSYNLEGEMTATSWLA